MAIYLDANVVWPWRTFAELDRLALSIVADQIGQRVFVPEVAVREAEEGYRRSLESAVDAHDAAVRNLRRLFEETLDVYVEPVPWPDQETANWRARLAGLAGVIPLDPRDAGEALEREITGRPPARQRVDGKPGVGARDAAIWLTVVRHHLAATEEGHFISANRRDFAGADGNLKSELAADLKSAQCGLRYYGDIQDFLAQLGTTAASAPFELDELCRRAEPMLQDTLRDAPDLPAAIWSELDDQYRYATRVQRARPLRILRQLRYEREREAVTLLDAEWGLVVDCLFQEADSSTPNRWSTISDIEVFGNIQLYLPERDGTQGYAQFIAARWRSGTTLFLHKSGEISSVTSIRDE